MKTKILVTSIATIVLCLCLIAGSTFALFTETTEVNLAVTAGDLDVSAKINDDSLKTRSFGDPNNTYPGVVRNKVGYFDNGGSVKINEDGKGVEILQMTPGDGFTFTVTVVNTGDVAVAYTVNWESVVEAADIPEGKLDMFDALDITATVRNGYTTKTFTDEDGDDVYYALGAPGSETTFTITVEFKETTESNDNKYQGGVANVLFTVKTVQANGIDSDGNIID